MFFNGQPRLNLNQILKILNSVKRWKLIFKEEMSASLDQFCGRVLEPGMSIPVVVCSCKECQVSIPGSKSWPVTSQDEQHRRLSASVLLTSFAWHADSSQLDFREQMIQCLYNVLQNGHTLIRWFHTWRTDNLVHFISNKKKTEKTSASNSYVNPLLQKNVVIFTVTKNIWSVTL
jgi:hypothetical protein